MLIIKKLFKHFFLGEEKSFFHKYMLLIIDDCEWF